MKRTLFAVLAVCIMAAGVHAVETRVNIPNLEASFIYDCMDAKIVSGVTSRFMSIGDMDIRIGYTENDKWITSIAYDLRNLEKLGPKVKYAWNDANLTIGLWGGYDFFENKMAWGFLATLVQVNFQ